jgi:hypothetical protein
VNPAISADEDFGLTRGYRLRSDSTRPFALNPPDTASRAQLSLHQGGIVDTPTGEWWGFSMLDYNSVGRLTGLSPVTWEDGWPYFGLRGNLGRTPRIWVKPTTGVSAPVRAPYTRNDEFDRNELANVWQWNHLPDDTRWSLTERRGFLRLHSLPASDLWWARNTLTQRAIGPRSTPTAVLESSGMQPGDVAGLALLGYPYAWIGVRRDSSGLTIEQFDQRTGRTDRQRIDVRRVWVRAEADFLTETAGFSYSTDGAQFTSLGDPFTMVFQLKTFQGIRYALFHYNVGGATGGYADFDAMRVAEPNARGLTQPIPTGRWITLVPNGSSTPVALGGTALFRVVDRGQGRIALGTRAGFVSVTDDARVVLRAGNPTTGETFQWIETLYGDVSLLSMVTHRYLRVDATSGVLSAVHLGPEPGRRDGAQFRWEMRSQSSRAIRR